MRAPAALATRPERPDRIFRLVNERIRELADTFGLGEPLQMFCECTRPACEERLTIEHARYDEVRAVGRRFFVAPGHEHPDRETVVGHGDGYRVVEER